MLGRGSKFIIMASTPPVYEKFFTNCRGVNWMPIYPTVHNANFGVGAIAGTAVLNAGLVAASRPTERKDFTAAPDWPFYNGTEYNGRIAMWRFFHEEDADVEIEKLHRSGINCVRTYLSYYAWKHEMDAAEGNFLSNLEKMCTLFDKHKIKVIWNFFDGVKRTEALGPANAVESIGTGQSAVASPYKAPGSAGYQIWDTCYKPQPEPGLYLSANEFADWWVSSTGGMEYVEDVVGVLSAHQSTLLYDISNEPEGLGDLGVTSGLIISALDYVKVLDPGQTRKTTVGFASITPWEGVQESYSIGAIAGRSTLDVLTFHPFSAFDIHMDEVLNIAGSALEDYGKPGLITECIANSEFATLTDNKNKHSNDDMGRVFFYGTMGYPWTSSPTRSTTIGVKVTSADGWNNIGGLLYSDGQCKSEKEMLALKDWAISAGWKENWVDTPKAKINSVDGSGLDGGFTNYISGMDLFPSSLLASYDFASNHTPAIGDSLAPNWGDPEGAFSALAPYDFRAQEQGNDYLLSSLRNWAERVTMVDLVNDNLRKKESRMQKQQLSVFSKFIAGHSGGIYSDIGMGISGTAFERGILTEQQQLDASAYSLSSTTIHEPLVGNTLTSWAAIDEFRDNYGVLINDILDTLGA